MRCTIATLGIAFLLCTGCDRTISEKETTKKHMDGSVTTSTETVKEKPDGTITVDKEKQTH
jgi:hypothetical protein